MANYEIFQIHPYVRIKWSDGKMILGRMDLSWELPLSSLDGLVLLNHFAQPAVPEEVVAKLGGGKNILATIEDLKNFNVLVSADEAQGLTLPFDIQAVDDGTFYAIHERCRPFTMADVFLNYSLYQGVRHIVSAGIDGDIVECGVWRGGSAMICALTLLQLGISDRKIYMYDSFDFTWPGYSEHDAQIYGRDNETTAAFVESVREKAMLAHTGKAPPLLSLEETRNNVISTGYPVENLIFVQGYVENTIPEQTPDNISLLRLDTDFYDSTIHELRHLYPRLSSGGPLIIDDYPTEVGATIATDEYFAESGESILLNRIGIQGRIGVRA